MPASTQIDIAAAADQAEANAALIKRFFRLLEEKNIDEWRALWADDGIYQVPYDDEDASYDVPFEREGTVATIFGADTIAKLFSVIPTYVRTARLFDIAIRQTLDPATVYVEFALEFLIDRTGVLYKNLGIGRMEIRDGKVRLFREYLDNDQRKKGWAGVFWNDEVAPAEASDRNADIVERFFAAFAAGDQEAIGGMIAEDMVWSFPGDSPIAGDWVGVDGLVNGIRATAMRLGDGKHGFELLRVYSNEDGAISIHRDFYTGDDGAFDLRYLIVFTIEDGVITRAEEIPSDQFVSDRYWNWRAAEVAKRYAPE